MENYTCELCEGNSFIKSEGSFICQSCGMRYSIDEMRKLLRSDSYGESANHTLKKIPKATATVSPQPSSSPKQHTKATQAKSSMNHGKAKKKRKLNLKFAIAVAIAIVMVRTFIVALMMGDANMLILSGILELLVAVVLYKIMIHMERYNCPACGAKRVHHREFIRTTEEDKTFSNQDGRAYKTIYTHHYLDTYVCNNCGETREERVSKSGGEYVELASGTVLDKRKPPKEF